LAVSDDRIIVLDAGGIVKSLRLTGEMEWNAGRQGRGPGEFVEPIAVSLDQNGSAQVYDPENARLTLLTRNGKVARTIPLPSRADRVVAGSGDAYVQLGTVSDTFARVVDPLGRVLQWSLLPADLRPIPAIAREMTAVIAQPEGSLVIFRWSSRMMLVDGTGKIIRSCAGIDSLSFPPIHITRLKTKIAAISNLRTERVDPRAREAATVAASYGKNIIVVPRRSGKDRIVDVYAGDCGTYVESRPFPFIVSQLAGNARFLIAMIAEPVPHLAVLRWVSR
jgi:hypothetical protein